MQLVLRWTLRVVVPLNVLLACLVASAMQDASRLADSNPLRLVLAVAFLMHLFGFLIALLPSIAIKLLLPAGTRLGEIAFILTLWISSAMLLVTAAVAPAALSSTRLPISKAYLDVTDAPTTPVN